MSTDGAAANEAELRDWLCAHLAASLKVADGVIDPDEPMAAYGLDSLRAIAVLTDVEDRVGFEIDPDVLWDYPTVGALARYLAERLTLSGEPA